VPTFAGRRLTGRYLIPCSRVLSSGVRDLLDPVPEFVDGSRGECPRHQPSNRACSGGSATSSEGGSSAFSTPGLVLLRIRWMTRNSDLSRSLAVRNLLSRSTSRAISGRLL